MWKKILTILILTFVLTVSLPEVLAVDASNQTNRYNVMVVLDASGSMKTTDSNGLRYDAIAQFVGLLAESGNYLGGIVFDTAISAQCDPVFIKNQSDKDLIINLLSSVEANDGWTNIGEALLSATESLVANGNPSLPSVILLLSDGSTDMATTEEEEVSLSQKSDAIQMAHDNDIPIYTVCLNANGQADLTEMEQISSATGGVFEEVSNANDLLGVFQNFYDLIYGTSIEILAPTAIPNSGCLETQFTIPGLGVEEVNIILYGTLEQIALYRPDGTESAISVSEYNGFYMVKLTDIIGGEWTLTTEGIPGDLIQINMVYNTNLTIMLSADTDSATIYDNEAVTIQALLLTGGVPATSASQYTGYTAELHIYDAYKTLLDTIPMEVNGNHFEVTHTFEQGVYYYDVTVESNFASKNSELVGPITVVEEGGIAVVNEPPIAVQWYIEEEINLWPFKTNTYTLDLSNLATDPEGDVLRYEVVSSAYWEGSEYVVENDVLTLTFGSKTLSKGHFTIEATDTGGLSCQIDVNIITHNIGFWMLMGLFALILIGVVILGILMYITLSKPFRGTISAQSCVNGIMKGVPRTPRRGRCKLTVFGMDQIGIPYDKTYFQATGQQYIFLITKKPVIWNGQPTTKVRLQSGIDAIIYGAQGDPRYMQIRFESRVRKAPRSGGGHPGKRPPVRPGQSPKGRPGMQPPRPGMQPPRSGAQAPRPGGQPPYPPTYPGGNQPPYQPPYPGGQPSRPNVPPVGYPNNPNMGQPPQYPR